MSIDQDPRIQAGEGEDLTKLYEQPVTANAQTEVLPRVEPIYEAHASSAETATDTFGRTAIDTQSTGSNRNRVIAASASVIGLAAAGIFGVATLRGGTAESGTEDDSEITTQTQEQAEASQEQTSPGAIASEATVPNPENPESASLTDRPVTSQETQMSVESEGVTPLTESIEGFQYRGDVSEFLAEPNILPLYVSEYQDSESLAIAMMHNSRQYRRTDLGSNPDQYFDITHTPDSLARSFFQEINAEITDNLRRFGPARNEQFTDNVADVLSDEISSDGQTRTIQIRFIVGSLIHETEYTARYVLTLGEYGGQAVWREERLIDSIEGPSFPFQDN